MGKSRVGGEVEFPVTKSIFVINTVLILNTILH